MLNNEKDEQIQILVLSPRGDMIWFKTQHSLSLSYPIFQKVSYLLWLALLHECGNLCADSVDIWGHVLLNWFHMPYPWAIFTVTFFWQVHSGIKVDVTLQTCGSQMTHGSCLNWQSFMTFVLYFLPSK